MTIDPIPTIDQQELITKAVNETLKVIQKHAIKWKYSKKYSFKQLDCMILTVMVVTFKEILIKFSVKPELFDTIIMNIRKEISGESNDNS